MLNEQEKLNVAIVGCGEIAKSHMSALKQINSLKVVTVCDKDEKIVTKKLSEWKIDHHYTDLSKMLDAEKSSILSVLAPPTSHAPLAIEAFNHGMHVLVEKTLTMSAKDSEPIFKALSKNKNVKLTINYNWLFNKVMIKTFSIYKSDTIDGVLSMDIKIVHRNDDRMTLTENYWCYSLPGDRFGEMLTHPIYLVQCFLGSYLGVERTSTYKRETYEWTSSDELNITLKGNNCKGNVYVSFNAPRPAILIDAYGSKKILKIDIINQTIIELGGRTLRKVDAAKDCLCYSAKITFLTARNFLDYLLEKSSPKLRYLNKLLKIVLEII